LESDRQINAFLASVERRAFRMALFALRDREEALDVLQDTMFRFVDRYGKRSAREWKPLFYRILQNRIKDWYRREAVRNRFRTWFHRRNRDEDPQEIDPWENLPDPSSKDPQTVAESRDTWAVLETAIGQLTRRQQQAFLLRAWEGMSVAETSSAMKCSEGSVKTHYARAVRSLRAQLEGQWP
jgi:RNA polymerase sigma-70 factor (ECF subfamily)